MSKIIDEDERNLVQIANILQEMIGESANYKTYAEIDPINETELRTCVAMIIRIKEDRLFLEPKKADISLEALNLQISNLIDTFACLEPQITSRLSEIVEANSPPSLAWQAQVIDYTTPLNTLISELTAWRDASTVLIDDLSLNSPKSKNRTSWRSRYVAKYVAEFYSSQLGKLPQNSAGNPMDRYVKSVDRIGKLLNFDFPAAYQSCVNVLNLPSEAMHLKPPILRQNEASQDLTKTEKGRSRDEHRKADNV